MGYEIIRPVADMASVTKIIEQEEKSQFYSVIILVIGPDCDETEKVYIRFSEEFGRTGIRLDGTNNLDDKFLAGNVRMLLSHNFSVVIKPCGKLACSHKWRHKLVTGLLNIGCVRIIEYYVKAPMLPLNPEKDDYGVEYNEQVRAFMEKPPTASGVHMLIVHNIE